jgi:penicillin G amidase
MWKKWLKRTLYALVGIAAVSVLGAYLWLRQSLPILDGNLKDASFALQASTRIERDAQGTAVIHANSRADAYFAQGFVHAQERFFEMDLARRSAAGELAELFGSAALPRDQAVRVHRMRSRMQRNLVQLEPVHKQLVERYRDGVNAGLKAHARIPFPYNLLGKAPRPWSAEDSLLTNAAMVFNLQDHTNSNELQMDAAKRVYSDAAYRYLFNRVSAQWDAPLMPGDAIADPALPSASELDLRALPVDVFDRAAAGSEAVRGSNNWAIAGHLSKTKSAIFANDMHLGLGVPSLWFRTQLNYPHPDTNKPLQITGVSLPGAPATVVGSNGSVAWGMTNSYGDWTDFVRLIPGSSAQHYQTMGGEELVAEHLERIAVSGANEVELKVRETRYGPIVGKDAQGLELALAWVAHRTFGPNDMGVDVRFIDFELQSDAVALNQYASSTGMPHNNVVSADRDGTVAWTIGGRIPLRAHNSPMSEIVDSKQLEGDVWSGFLAPEGAPRVTQPADGLIYTANSRVVNQEALALVGNNSFALGARARRIRELLQNRAGMTEAYLLQVQLDDQAPLLERWWHRALQATANNDKYAGVRTVLNEWNRKADQDSAAYRIVRNFRLEILQETISGLSAPVRAAAAANANPAAPESLGRAFSMNFPGHAEVMVWPILEQQALHLLPQPHQNFESFERACLDRALAKMLDTRYLDASYANTQKPFAALPLDASQLSADPLRKHTWGEQNTARISHPLARAIPALGWLLNMRADPLSGDTGHIVRAQGPAFGASQRLVVSPGHEAGGILHMPGGQSGHPLSPYFGAGHSDWVDGLPTPLLPGEIEHTLVLQ